MTLLQDVRYALRMLVQEPRLHRRSGRLARPRHRREHRDLQRHNALLLRPLPYEDADRIAILWNDRPGLNVAQDWFSTGQYLDIRTDNQVFSEVAATIGASFNLTGRGLPERVDGARVSSSLFPLFGAKAASGRVFSAERISREAARGHPEQRILEAPLRFRPVGRRAAR